MKRVTTHLRRDSELWTLLFICDPFPGYEESRYTPDVPGNALSTPSSWIMNCLNNQSSQEYLGKVAEDAFGLVVKVLRDIKTSWKLMLSDMELFLENIVRYRFALYPEPPSSKSEVRNLRRTTYANS